MIIGKNVTMTDRQTTGIGEDGEPSPTLQANHHHAVAVAGFMGGQGEKAGSLGFREECAPTLKGVPSGSNQVPDVLVTGSHWDSPANPHPTLEATDRGVGASDQTVFSQRGAMLVSDVVSQYGDIAGAITARNDSSPCPDRGPTVVCYENNPTDARQKETDVSPSVLARWGTGGNQTPLVQETFALAENTIGRQPHNGGNGMGAQKEPGYTLNATGQQGVSDSGFVRRLTTVECARLQGFPDHHTEIPWRGKPASECPNGPQYKAYGNSMCVNVMEWLGRKIQGEIYANSTSEMAR